ncbi:MAG: DUF4398 domain-containing protein [Gammaproteobacteria bacterium]|nr:DUF4398 domain-containing protein [Gammaproteobacteria bacterium]
MIVSRLRYLAPLMFSMMLGCTSIPTQEMSDARQAVQAARDANAGQLAPEIMEGAETLLNRAKQALDAGAYNQARDEAVAARREAIKARSEALKAAPLP